MLQELRTRIATAISSGIPDLQASPYVLGNPTPPCAYVYPGPTTYDLAMSRGLDEWELRVRAYTGDVADQGAQVVLDQLIEPHGGRSMKAAIEVDMTLGGLLGPGGCRVASNTGYTNYLHEGRGPLLGTEWILVIRASGA